MGNFSECWDVTRGFNVNPGGLGKIVGIFNDQIVGAFISTTVSKLGQGCACAYIYTQLSRVYEEGGPFVPNVCAGWWGTPPIPLCFDKPKRYLVGHGKCSSDRAYQVLRFLLYSQAHPIEEFFPQDFLKIGNNSSYVPRHGGVLFLFAKFSRSIKKSGELNFTQIFWGKKIRKIFLPRI